MAWRHNSRVNLGRDYDKLPPSVRAAIANGCFTGLFDQMGMVPYVSADDLVRRIKAADAAICTGANCDQLVSAQNIKAREILCGK